jgi:hypothetical protein
MNFMHTDNYFINLLFTSLLKRIIETNFYPLPTALVKKRLDITINSTKS